MIRETICFSVRILWPNSIHISEVVRSKYWPVAVLPLYGGLLSYRSDNNNNTKPVARLEEETRAIFNMQICWEPVNSYTKYNPCYHVILKISCTSLYVVQIKWDDSVHKYVRCQTMMSVIQISKKKLCPSNITMFVNKCVQCRKRLLSR